MENFIIRGQVLDSEGPDSLRFVQNGYLPVTNGLCRGVYKQIPEAFSGLPLTDYGDRLIVPGMCDLHLHAPQFYIRGLGMDRELLEWLNAYTFPEEAKFRDLAYADRAYNAFVTALRRTTTTRAAVFASVHTAATLLLMEKLEASGLITLVGKVNMDRNCPEDLREPDADTAFRETEQWLCAARERFLRTKPILTPRFIPACSDALMAGLKNLQRKYQLPVQSHLSENGRESELVRELAPAARFYGDAYDRFGLFGGDHPCIMAHCVHSGEEELIRMQQNGVFIAHCPESNMNLSSGAAPVSRYLALGLNVGLASDIGGGSQASMLRVMMYAIQVSKLRWRLLDPRIRPLTLAQAFYLATAGGGAFFGKVGRFEDGYEFDAVVIDDSCLDCPQPLEPESRLERAVYLADDRQIFAKYVAGKRLFERNGGYL